MNDFIPGFDGVMMKDVHSEDDQLNLLTEWSIHRYEDERAYLKRDPYKVSEFKPNLLLNEGITNIFNLIALTGGTKWDNANAYLGVGDGTALEAPTQTGLQGANKTYKKVDSGYPSVSDQTITWQATFGPTEGNHGWKEFTLANGNSDSATNLNRKTSDQGTKVSGQVWELRMSLTLG